MENEKIKFVENDLIFFENNLVGEGVFGKVFKGKVKKTKEIIAIKKVFQDKRYKNRELSIMKELSHHPNTVSLLGYYYTEQGTYLNIVMDYIPNTLSNLISINRKKNKSFPMILIKLFAFQMLKGVGHINSHGICHRDIKPDNILICDDYTLKYCDFGCGKKLVKNEPNITYMCARFYRPPELIFECSDYTTQVDIWSVGCCIAETVLNRPLFPGKSKDSQLEEIMKIMGNVTDEQIKLMNPKYNKKFETKNDYKTKEWKEVFNGKTDDFLFIDLVSKLIVYEPQYRLGPYQALCHPYFDELRNTNLILPNGKKIPSHLFEFEDCEKKFDYGSIQYLTYAK